MDINGSAVIFGGASGIGKACSQAFALEGAAEIIIADIDLDSAEKVAQELTSIATAQSFRSRAIKVDVASEDSVKQAVDEVVQYFGRIDYCVNSAGIGVQIAKEMSEADSAEFDRFLRINVMGTFLVTRYVSAAMKAQAPIPISTSAVKRGLTRGAIVNLGSLASFISQPGQVQYTASKHAVLGITKNAALDNAPHAIRVNCLCPSWVDTQMVRKAVESVPGLQQMIESAVPMGRVACPEEIADAAIFLCSYRSSYMTGSAFIVDGGTSLSGKV
ncbi:NAD(P)-binding protein [Hypoxylon sp. FL0890]|nr:NAD(P)-binding protein [Hypoxylon sp. FL0890]